jgi:tetratricopeptide (TPR) repeat protein
MKGARKIVLFACSLSLLLTSTATVLGARIQADMDDLRKLASLPPMSFTVEVVASRGRLRWKQELAAPEQIATLQKELRGDSTDAVRLLELGWLLEEAGRTNQAASSYSNAVTAFRQQIQSHPKDGQLLSQLGEALAEVDQPLEAESMLRNAVRIAPKDPKCWGRLGLFLSDNSRSALYPEKPPQEVTYAPSSLATKYKPSAEQLERAEKLSHESIECFNQAISLGPKEAPAYEGRACGLSSAAFIRTLKQQITSPDPDRLAIALTFALTPFSPECLPDLRRAAELQPRDASLVAAVAFGEVLCATMSNMVKKGGRVEQTDKAWDLLAPDQAKSVRENLNRLAELMKGPEKEKASSAAKYLGLLQFTVMGDEGGGEQSLRTAVSLNPKSQEAWEALMLTAGKDNNYERMVEVAEEMVRAIDSSLSHLCLAKAHEKLNHWDKVLEQVQAAVKVAPNDLTAKVAVASTLLRLNQSKNESVKPLELRSDEFQQADLNLRVHILFVSGLELALDDKAEQARSLFQQALQFEADHEGAKRALTIIDSWK